MKHSSFDHGNVLRMPSKRTNPIVWDTVLESVNDQLGKKFFLTLGTASVLATAISLAAHAEIVSVNQEVYLTGGPPGTAKPLDMDDDGMPDLSCTASVTFDDGRANGEVECIDINGEIVEVGDGICDLPKRDEDSIDDDDQEAGTQVCPEGADRYLAIKTSGDRNAWVKVVMDADRLVAKAVGWWCEECPQPQPPSELTSQIDLSGNLILAWKDNSDNETGFKVYRDGKLIGMTAANVTSYSDNSLPCDWLTVTYAVVATNEGQDSVAATVTVMVKTEGNTCLSPEGVVAKSDSPDQVEVTWTDADGEIGYNLYRNGQLIAQLPANVTRYIDYSVTAGKTYSYRVEAIYDNRVEPRGEAMVTTPDGPPPVSRLFIAPDGSCTGSVTLTIDGHFGTSCASTDCQTVKKPNGETVQNCAPNCSLAFDEDDIGKDVKLAPHANAGCVFSSWGGHHDCADDSKITVTTLNKLCIAFFRPRETQGTRINSTRANPLTCADTKVLYVNQTATGTGTGCSWQDAIPDLSKAIAWVGKGQFPQVREIWVAKGTYHIPKATGPQLTFSLLNGVGIYGGFAGNETQLDQRDIRLNLPFLSCDCEPVVTVSGIDASAKLTGMIISADSCDSGLWLDDATPTLDKVYVVSKDNWENVLCRWEESKLIFPDLQE